MDQQAAWYPRAPRWDRCIKLSSHNIRTLDREENHILYIRIYKKKQIKYINTMMKERAYYGKQ